MLSFVCKREFEKHAAGLVDELYEMDQDKSHQLLTTTLQSWHKKINVLRLADNAKLMVFMEQDCCQTELDKIWHGKLHVATSKEIWKVAVCSILCDNAIP